jgi:hypothetical protein
MIDKCFYHIGDIIPMDEIRAYASSELATLGNKALKHIRTKPDNNLPSHIDHGNAHLT